MKLFIILSLICYCNAAKPIEINVLQFERSIYNFADLLLPYYVQTNNDLSHMISMYKNHKGIYSFYNLSQSIVPLYKVCENDVNVFVKVLDKLANHGGNGPSIEVSLSQLSMIQKNFIEIVKADGEVAKDLAVQEMVVKKVLSKPMLSSNGMILHAPAAYYNEFIATLNHFDTSNKKLGNAAKAAGSLRDTNVVNQKTRMESKVVKNFLNYLIKVGDAYNKVGQVGKNLALKIDRHFGSLNKDNKTHDVNLSLLGQLLVEAVGQLKHNLNDAKILLENLVDSFTGPYKRTKIPMA